MSNINSNLVLPATEGRVIIVDAETKATVTLTPKAGSYVAETEADWVFGTDEAVEGAETQVEVFSDLVRISRLYHLGDRDEVEVTRAAWDAVVGEPEPEPWIEGYILTRAEGRTDDAEWPVGNSMVFERITSRIDDRLRRAAKIIGHNGYDKFDLEVIYSDGDRVRLRLDLDNKFTSLGDYFPTLPH